METLNHTERKSYAYDLKLQLRTYNLKGIQLLVLLQLQALVRDILLSESEAWSAGLAMNGVL